MTKVHKANVDVMDKFNNTPLADAVSNNNQAVAHWLLEEGGAELSALQDSLYLKTSSIFTAAAHGNAELVRLLLSGRYVTPHQCSANTADYDNRTPLHLAATEGHNEVVVLLLANKADPNIRDRWGQLPLQNARRHRHKDVIATLKAAVEEDGHEMEFSSDDDGLTQATSSTSLLPPRPSSPRNAIISASTRLLIEAAARGDLDEMRQLVAKGANINGEDYDGRTPLHLGAACNHVDVVQWLLKLKHLRINVFDRFGNTPLSEALNLRDAGKPIVAVLKAHGVCSWRSCAFSA